MLNLSWLVTKSGNESLSPYSCVYPHGGFSISISHCKLDLFLYVVFEYPRATSFFAPWNIHSFAQNQVSFIVSNSLNSETRQRGKMWEKQWEEEEKDRANSYLDVREEHFEHVGGRVAGVEEHQLGLLQVVGRQALLNLNNNMLRKQQVVALRGVLAGLQVQVTHLKMFSVLTITASFYHYCFDIQLSSSAFWPYWWGTRTT